MRLFRRNKTDAAKEYLVASKSDSNLGLSRGKVIALGFEPKEIKLEATVIRCGCGDPDNHFSNICPAGVEEVLGIISYFNEDEVKQALWESEGIIDEA